MKIAKKLACMFLTGIIVLAHVPMTAFAQKIKVENKATETKSPDFKFEVKKLTLTTIGKEYDLEDYLVDGLGTGQVSYSCLSGDDVVEVDSGGIMKVVGEGEATVIAETVLSDSYDGYVNASTNEICIASASNATSATIIKNQPYKATLKVVVKTGSGGGSSGGGGGGGGGGTGAVANSGTRFTQSGAVVTTNTAYLGNGTRLTMASITISGRTINAQEKVSALPDGSSQRLFSFDGNLAGLTFAGGGVVSEDGTTIKTPTGNVFMITYAPMCIVTDVNGTTIGCFIDPATGQPISFGEDTVLMQIGMDGQMHAHFINPQGYFYVGMVTMNGSTFVFNEEGVMISYA